MSPEKAVACKRARLESGAATKDGPARGKWTGGRAGACARMGTFPKPYPATMLRRRPNT
ncbi:MAG TPA: hypothetical protein VMY43_01390 [Methanothrix sp.]|nr:hypothetical protein [Methanothrix sp.]